MNRLFAETYAKDQEIEAHYDAAELKNDSADMEQARADHFALETGIQAQGRPFELLYSLYAAAMKVGNEYIDISELHELFRHHHHHPVHRLRRVSGRSAPSRTDSSPAQLRPVR